MRVLSLLILLTVGSLAPLAAQDVSLSCPHPSGSAQVVIDPGHGGVDPGAVNETYGLWEKTLALEIAVEAARIVEAKGYSVALTRADNDTALGNSERGSIANACGALVFIEIHLNATADPAIDYTVAYWGIKEKDLALAITMNDALDQLGIPVSAAERFDNGGLLRARMPSVLVETVFLSHPGEAADLSNGTRQAGIASAVADGILAWLEHHDDRNQVPQESAP
jgi:N-acetylmuramoyl-L-alanine amidase